MSVEELVLLLQISRTDLSCWKTIVNRFSQTVYEPFTIPSYLSHFVVYSCPAKLRDLSWNLAISLSQCCCKHNTHLTLLKSYEAVRKKKKLEHVGLKGIVVCLLFYWEY